MSTDLETAEGTESRELVRFVTQQTRFALVNNILQHPDQLPSMYELEVDVVEWHVRGYAEGGQKGSGSGRSGRMERAATRPQGGGRSHI